MINFLLTISNSVDITLTVAGPVLFWSVAFKIGVVVNPVLSIFYIMAEIDPVEVNCLVQLFVFLF